MDGKHKCPIANCQTMIPDDISLCTHHYRKAYDHQRIKLCKARLERGAKYERVLAQTVRKIEKRIAKNV